jgi:transcriptional regulator with PAS, ATPase and Fis domain
MIRRTDQALVGSSGAMATLKAEIHRVARSDAKVLITGESGTGKELVANAVHTESGRASAPFVAMNCAGLPETLLESELFGHVKGSFTGAFRDSCGKLEAADRGTIFLDEVAEMTLRMQGLLLRFVETGEIQKVGADSIGRRVDVRIFAATNRELREMVRVGTFREDLFYRLNVVHVRAPSLRDHSEDIPELVDYFLKRFTSRLRGCPVRTIDAEAFSRLAQYSWPGNVRELENVIERLVVIGEHETVSAADLPIEICAPNGRRTGAPLRERRHTIVDDLYVGLTEQEKSFWTSVYPLYMQRDITRANVRELVRRGLEQSRGSYRILAGMFNMDEPDYRRFLNFLRKHDCQVPFKEYRTSDVATKRARRLTAGAASLTAVGQP